MTICGLDSSPESITDPSYGPASTSDFESGTSQSRYLGLTVFFLAYALVYAFRSELALRDPDTLWHIRTGQWMLENVQWPNSDIFSWTFLGEPWIAKEWLSQVVLTIAYQLGGWHGVAALTAAIYAAIAATLAVYLIRFLRFSIAIGLAGVTVLLISPHFLARPHLLAYLLLSIWLISILNSLDGNKPLPLGLAALMLLWANVHSTFVLGLALFSIPAIFVFARSFMNHDFSAAKWAVTIAVIVSVAGICTPYGLGPLVLTWKIMGMKAMMNNLIEWHPPNFREYPAALFFIVAFVTLISGLGIKLCLPRLGILAMATWLGFSYTRGFILFLLIVPLIIAFPSAQQVPVLKAQRINESNDAVVRFFYQHARSVALLCCGLAIIASVFSWHFRELEPPLSVAPNEAIKYVKEADIKGRVFNSYDFGGYLIFSGIPTFVDGRADLYGDDFLRRYFAAINLEDQTASFALLDDYKIDWAILRPSDPLTKALHASMTWLNVYSDESAAVFVRGH